MMMMTELLRNDITEGGWVIGDDPATGNGGVSTADKARDQWPHQVRDWRYHSDQGWQSDPLLTLTGDIYIDIL